MTLGGYFNEGDGKDADLDVKDAWNAMRDFVTATFGDVMRVKADEN